MQGGDLYSALQSNAQGIGVAHPLSWWRRGRSVALDIARGLHFLHSEHVVLPHVQAPLTLKLEVQHATSRAACTSCTLSTWCCPMCKHHIP